MEVSKFANSQLQIPKTDQNRTNVKLTQFRTQTPKTDQSQSLIFEFTSVGHFQDSFIIQYDFHQELS